MGVRGLLPFSDALRLLRCDPPAVAALDRALGGALNLAAGGVGDGLLRIADARGSVLALGRAAVRGTAGAWAVRGAMPSAPACCTRHTP
ncbi:hypothetical protein [Streptomyces sp. NPDC049590]|uniref:NACHT N-terminal helical domain 7-containing protein n=1 Tax=Streptomyces sp. NPDC049590 TaxID=3154834 RepID=UPI00342B094D